MWLSENNRNNNHTFLNPIIIFLKSILIEAAMVSRNVVVLVVLGDDDWNSLTLNVRELLVRLPKWRVVVYRRSGLEQPSWFVDRWSKLTGDVLQINTLSDGNVGLLDPEIRPIRSIAVDTERFDDVALSADFYRQLVKDVDDVKDVGSEVGRVLFYQQTAMLVEPGVVDGLVEYEVVLPVRTDAARGLRGLLLIDPLVAIGLLESVDPGDVGITDYWEYFSSVDYSRSGVKVPSVADRKRFSVESVFDDRPFAVVQPWGLMDGDGISGWDYSSYFMGLDSGYYSGKLLMRQRSLDYYGTLSTETIPADRLPSGGLPDDHFDRFTERYLNETLKYDDDESVKEQRAAPVEPPNLKDWGLATKEVDYNDLTREVLLDPKKLAEVLGKPPPGYDDQLQPIADS